MVSHRYRSQSGTRVVNLHIGQVSQVRTVTSLDGLQQPGLGCAGHHVGDSWSEWSAAEPNLVPVGIVIRSLAHTVRVGLSLRGLDPPVGYMSNEFVEVVDEDGVHSMTGMFGSLLDEHRPVLGKFPHGLCVARDERWWRAEQPFVPGQRRRVVVDWDSSVQVKGHSPMLIRVGPEEG